MLLTLCFLHYQALQFFYEAGIECIIQDTVELVELAEHNSLDVLLDGFLLFSETQCGLAGQGRPDRWQVLAGYQQLARVVTNGCHQYEIFEQPVVVRFQLRKFVDTIYYHTDIVEIGDDSEKCFSQYRLGRRFRLCQILIVEEGDKVWPESDDL